MTTTTDHPTAPTPATSQPGVDGSSPVDDRQPPVDDRQPPVDDRQPPVGVEAYALTYSGLDGWTLVTHGHRDSDTGDGGVFGDLVATTDGIEAWDTATAQAWATQALTGRGWRATGWQTDPDPRAWDAGWVARPLAPGQHGDPHTDDRSGCLGGCGDCADADGGCRCTNCNPTHYPDHPTVTEPTVTSPAGTATAPTAVGGVPGPAPQAGGGWGLDRDAATAWLAATVGDGRGQLAVAFGYDGTWTGRDRWEYPNGKWVQRTYPWPGAGEQLLDDVADQLAAGTRVDVFVCPYLRAGTRRAKGNATARPLIHADRDAPTPVDRDRLRTLGGFAVASGTPGHEHLYVPLTGDLDPAGHERLCRALAVHLGDCDPKVSDNDVLRLPGTANFKHTPPAPVTFTHRPVPVRPRPEHLARLLATDPARPANAATPGTTPGTRATTTGGPASAGPVATAVEAVDCDALPRAVQLALAEVSGDRSVDTMRIVAACHAAGLTLAATRGTVTLREDLAVRLDGRGDDDVLTCWLKATDSRQHPTTRAVNATAGPDPAPGPGATSPAGDTPPAGSSEQAMEPEPGHKPGADSAGPASGPPTPQWLAGTPRPLQAAATAPPPPFPLAAFPPRVAEACAAVAGSVKCALDLPANAALGVLAAAVGGRAVFDVNSTDDADGWSEPTNLYLWPTAASGDGKSPGTAPIFAPIEERQARLRADGRADRAVQAAAHESATERVEAARAALRKAHAAPAGQTEIAPEKLRSRVQEVEAELADALDTLEATPPPVPPTLCTTGDATPEALQKLMAFNGGRLAILSSEGGIVDVMLGRFSRNPDLIVFMRAVNGERLDSQRIGRDVPDMPCPALSMVACIQPVLLARVMGDREIVERGVVPRVLIACPAPSTDDSDPTPTPRAPLHRWAALVDALADNAARYDDAPARVRFTPPAVRALYDYRALMRARARTNLALASEWAAKHAARLARLAVLLHLAADPDHAWTQPVTADTLDQARHLGEYYVAHLRVALAIAEEDTNAGDQTPPAVLLRWLARRPDGGRTGPGRWTPREIQAGLSGNKRFPDATAVREALDVLAERGWIWIHHPPRTRPSGPPPSPIVTVHPAAYASTDPTGPTGPTVQQSAPTSGDAVGDDPNTSPPIPNRSNPDPGPGPTVGEPAPPVGTTPQQHHRRSTPTVGKVGLLDPNAGPHTGNRAPGVTFSDTAGHTPDAIAARHTLTGTRCSCGTTYPAATPHQAHDHHAHHIAELAARWATLDHHPH